MKKYLLLMAVMAALLSTGCSKTTQIYSVNDYPAPQKLSMQEMERCILDAGKITGWQMSAISPGLIEGINRFNGIKHIAVVKITYNTMQYSILYKSSANLKAEKTDGRIHKIYNKKVRHLEQAINNFLRSAHIADDAYAI